MTYEYLLVGAIRLFIAILRFVERCLLLPQYTADALLAWVIALTESKLSALAKCELTRHAPLLHGFK